MALGPGAGRDYEGLLAASSRRIAAATGSAETDAVLQLYTSGTTGRAKGVLLSHRNLLANTWTNRVEGSVIPSDRYLASAPLAHVAAALGSSRRPRRSDTCDRAKV